MRMGCVDFAGCVVSATAPLAMSAALAIAPVLSRSRRDRVIASPYDIQVTDKSVITPQCMLGKDYGGHVRFFSIEILVPIIGADTYPRKTKAGWLLIVSLIATVRSRWFRTHRARLSGWSGNCASYSGRSALFRVIGPVSLGSYGSSSQPVILSDSVSSPMSPEAINVVATTV